MGELKRAASRLRSRKPKANPRAGSRAPRTAGLAAAIGSLYEDVGRSDSVFGSPLGPLASDGGPVFLPQFVYFGPGSSSDPVRLAIYSGFKGIDIPGARTLLRLVSELVVRPDIGQGLSVSIFPAVNVRAVIGGHQGLDLSCESWLRSREPEIRLLRDNANLRRYQGYIRIAGTDEGAPSAVVRTALSGVASRSGVEVYSSADFEPWSTLFETERLDGGQPGPLSLSHGTDDAPFDVALAVPRSWPQGRWNRELIPLLKRLIVGYRGFISFARNL